MKKIYILILALVAASGCVAYLPEEILLPLEDISLTMKYSMKMKDSALTIASFKA